MSAKDKQVGGSHYKDYAIQPVEFIQRNNLGFLEGCVIKRMCRWRAKNGIEDLRKAIHEIELLIEHAETVEDENVTWTKEQAEQRAKERLAVKLKHPMISDSLTPAAEAAVKAHLAGNQPAPAANPNIPAMGVRPEGPYPLNAPNGTRLLTWRPRDPGDPSFLAYGWVEIGFMWDGQLVPHKVAS